MFAERLKNLKPYIPGEQPKDREYIKLNANENPYPPAEAISNVLKNFNVALLQRYPDPDSKDLCKAIARMVGTEVKQNMIFVGNGSDEILSFVFYALFDSDNYLLFPEYTYSFYPVYAGYYDLPYKRIPVKKDFSIDLNDYVSENSSGIIFANPNAPTGHYLTVDEIRSFLQNYPSNKAVVVDEAYIDFAPKSAVSLVHEFSNLVVVRTFSKGFCFAGSRLGYAIAQPNIIAALLTTKNSFNHFPVDSVTQKLGISVCENISYYRKKNDLIKHTREDFSKKLKSAGWNVIPSQANFLMVKKEGFSGRSVYEHVKKHGILIRHFDIDGISDYVRISIGLPEQMETLVTILRAM